MTDILKRTPDGQVVYSFSTLSQQAICPARNYFHQLEKRGEIEVEIVPPLIYGSAVHKGIEDRLKYGRNPYDAAQEYLQENLFDKYPGSKVEAVKTEERWEKAKTCIDNFENHFYAELSQTIQDPEKQVEVQLETPFRKGILVGRVDVMMPGIFADWKSSAPPSQTMIAHNPQAGFYFYLAQQNGMEPPKEFVYVYLLGQNIAYTPYKSGKKIGQMHADGRHPNYIYNFPVMLTEQKVNKWMNEFVLPLARSYEEGIVYKNISQQNCSQCQYRNICHDYDLPAIVSD